MTLWAFPVVLKEVPVTPHFAACCGRPRSNPARTPNRQADREIQPQVWLMLLDRPTRGGQLASQRREGLRP